MIPLRTPRGGRGGRGGGVCGRQAAGLRQSLQSGCRVGPRPDRLRPLLAVPGRPAPSPIKDGAYVPIGGGVQGCGWWREDRLQDGRTALRRVEGVVAGPARRGPTRQGRGDWGTVQHGKA